MRKGKLFLGSIFTLVASAAFSYACSVDYPATAFRCDPSSDAPCPEVDGKNYFCCSDDPAALDLDDPDDRTALPGYQGRGGSGTPIFSGSNNSLSASGMCVDINAVPAGAGLADPGATGCPVPCNPTWDGDDIEDVCGANAICCQSVELDITDCILGNDDCWRPATGQDALDGVGGTSWGPTQHATAQDPGVPADGGCRTFANGAAGAAGISADDLFNDCAAMLTVADKRGYCLGIMPPNVVACPLDNPAYINACDERNQLEGKTSCL